MGVISPSTLERPSRVPCDGLGQMRMMALRARARGGPKRAFVGCGRSGEWWDPSHAAPCHFCGVGRFALTLHEELVVGACDFEGTLGPIPQVRRGYPPSLSI